jgi:hypothetical protein
MSFRAYIDPVFTAVSVASIDDVYETGIPAVDGPRVELAKYLEDTYDRLTEIVSGAPVTYEPTKLRVVREAWKNYMVTHYDKLGAYGAGRLSKWSVAMRFWVLICTANVLIERPWNDDHPSLRVAATDLQWVQQQALAVSSEPVLAYPLSVLKLAIQVLVTRWITLTDLTNDLAHYLYLLELRVSMLLLRPERGERNYDDLDWRTVLETGDPPVYGPSTDFYADTCAIFRWFHNAMRTCGAWPLAQDPLPGRAPIAGQDDDDDDDDDDDENVEEDANIRDGINHASARHRLRTHIELVASEKRSSKFRSALRALVGKSWIRAGERERFQRKNYGEQSTTIQLLQAERPFAQVEWYLNERFGSKLSILQILHREELWVREILTLQLVDSFFHAVFHLRWERQFVVYAEVFELHAETLGMLDAPLIIQSFQGYDVLYWEDAQNAKPPPPPSTATLEQNAGSPPQLLHEDNDEQFDDALENDDDDDDADDDMFVDADARRKVLYVTRTAEQATYLWCWFVWTCMNGEPAPSVNIRPFLREIFDPIAVHVPTYQKHAYDVPI